MFCIFTLKRSAASIIYSTSAMGTDQSMCRSHSSSWANPRRNVSKQKFDVDKQTKFVWFLHIFAVYIKTFLYFCFENSSRRNTRLTILNFFQKMVIDINQHTWTFANNNYGQRQILIIKRNSDEEYVESNFKVEL